MIDFQKYLVYILSTLLMGASIIFMPEVADNLSSIYLITIGAFLGIDLATTLVKTKKLPDGDFKVLKKDRYIVTALMSTILTAMALYMKENHGASLLDTITMLSVTLMGIGAMYIGALEGNKLFTGEKPIEPVTPSNESKIERLHD